MRCLPSIVINNSFQGAKNDDYHLNQSWISYLLVLTPSLHTQPDHSHWKLRNRVVLAFNRLCLFLSYSWRSKECVPNISVEPVCVHPTKKTPKCLCSRIGRRSCNVLIDRRPSHTLLFIIIIIQAISCTLELPIIGWFCLANRFNYLAFCVWLEPMMQQRETADLETNDMLPIVSGLIFDALKFEIELPVFRTFPKLDWYGLLLFV